MYILLRDYFLRYPLLFALVIIITYIAGTLAAADVAQHEGTKDPSRVVVDEVVGQWIALFLLPFSWKIALLSFIVFRIMDIWKPFPIKKLECFEGGTGIMLDDVLAGVYANILIQLLILVPSVSKFLH